MWRRAHIYRYPVGHRPSQLFLYVLVGEGILIFPWQKIAAGINKNHVLAVLVGSAFFTTAVKDKYGYRNRGSREEVARQTNDGIEQVLFDDFFTYAPFGSTTEQDAMGHDYGNAPLFFQCRFYHVADKGPIALTLGWYATPEAVVPVAFCFFGTPLVQRKWRIGDHPVEFHQPVIFDQCRTDQGIAPFNAGTVGAVQKHVHPCQRPGAAIRFHAKEGKVFVADFAGSLDKQPC